MLNCQGRVDHASVMIEIRSTTEVATESSHHLLTTLAIVSSRKLAALHEQLGVFARLGPEFNLTLVCHGLETGCQL